MEVFQTVVALIVTLGILVTFHEYGHYWVARRCGVKVLRFSVGFGKPLWGWKGKDGTEYVVAAIPLGGYVKFLDEREAPVPEDQLDQAFNRKPVLQRIAIVAAGPVANFLFAIAAYWVMFVWGVQAVAPVVGEVAQQSVAAHAGLRSNDEIVRVDGKQTPDWSAVHLQLLSHLGDTGEIRLSVQGQGGGEVRDLRVPVERWLVGQTEPNPILELGIQPYRPTIPAVLQEVMPESPAQKAGLQSGDHILSANQQPIEDWLALVELIRDSAGVPLLLEVERGGRVLELTVTPGVRNEQGESVGFIGAGVQPQPLPDWLIRTIQYGPLESLTQAVDRTGEMIVMIIDSIKKMLFGQISVKNLSGPVTIAQAAGQSASYGVESFITFLAYLSISLGVLNLLPIPVLDGGHLLYYFVELVRGRPLSEQKQVLGLKIGLALLMAMMMLAFYNDLARL